ncbi:MAG: hydrogenase iron-sulfur subunit [Deltaproteobacteria bacterium]|nr:hydrogenase iron-sulfur subunit [Deltaproteobacteria bacterium]
MTRETVGTASTKTISLSTDVLVLGGGYTAIKCAAALSKRGFGVFLAHPGEDLVHPAGPAGAPAGDWEPELAELVDHVRQDKNIIVFDRARLKKAAGMPGDFSVTLRKGDADVVRTVGAVVVAPEFDKKSLHEKYGLSLSDNVVTQSTLDAMLEADDPVLSGKGSVAFVAGFAQEGTTLLVERVLTQVRRLKKRRSVDVYVIIGNINLAAEGLDRLYAMAREEGALYFKLNEPPEISQDPVLSLVFRDPVLRRKMLLEPDLLVVEEQFAAPEQNRSVARLLLLKAGPSGFLQPDNVHFSSVRTTREGIFAAGPARGYLDLPQGFMDAENAAMAVEDILDEGKAEVPAQTAEVDRDKCAICLTCFRVCPHGAVSWDDKAKISPLACQACGLCASECPQEAIQVHGFSDRELEGRIAGAAKDGAEAPTIVAFLCKNSAWPAWEAARAMDHPLPGGFKPILVPCAGEVDVDYILDAFVQGADGVLAAACHAGNCRFHQGNRYAARRVDNAKRLLSEAGIDPQRLAFARVAANMGVEFSRIAMQMHERLEKRKKT